MLCNVNFAVIIIVATAVLHNYSLMRNLPDLTADPITRAEMDDDNVNNDNIYEERSNADNGMRNTIIEHFFS